MNGREGSSQLGIDFGPFCPSAFPTSLQLTADLRTRTEGGKTHVVATLSSSTAPCISCPTISRLYSTESRSVPCSRTMSFRSWKRVASSVMDLAMDVIWVIEREMERCEMRDARCEMRDARGPDGISKGCEGDR
jgi:hypothetical protein